MMTEVKSNLIHEWSKSSTFKQVSSFGSGPKDAHRRAIVDDGFDAIRSSLDWVAYDSNNNHHGRFRIESALGKLLNTPGAGHYEPKIDFLAKRENTPLITIANRRYDRYFDDLADLKRSQSALLLKQNPADKIRSEQIRSYKVRQGQFSNVNIDAIRLSMLPGPGSYDGKPELVERFHRPPMPRLRPRQPVAVPRKKIMVATLDIIDTPSQREPEGVYDLTNDPRQIKKAITIGQQRPLLSKRVYVAAGPGHYNLDKMAALRPGEKEVLSTVSHLKPRPVGSFQPYREAMKPSKFTVKKSSIFLLSETE